MNPAVTLVGHTIRATTLNEAEQKIFIALSTSTPQVYEDSWGTKVGELRRLTVIIENPYTDYWREGDWNLAQIEGYAAQMQDSNLHGFAYTYGNRGFAWRAPWQAEPPIDQYKACLEELRSDPSSRRAVMTFGIPSVDLKSENRPCMRELQFLIRDGRVEGHVDFRSHDMVRAWKLNMIGIAKIVARMAADLGLEPGLISVVSKSAHFYWRDLGYMRAQIRRYKKSRNCREKVLYEIDKWSGKHRRPGVGAGACMADGAPGRGCAAA